MDRWRDDDGQDPSRPRRGSPRSDDDHLDLSWQADDDRSSLDPDTDADLSSVGFDERYEPDVLAAIEAGPRRLPREEQPVSTVSQWRRRSALGAVLTGMALGFQEVFDPEEERSIVIEVDEDGQPGDLPVQMFLDPDSPAGSLCIVQRDGVPPPVV